MTFCEGFFYMVSKEWYTVKEIGVQLLLDKIQFSEPPMTSTSSRSYKKLSSSSSYSSSWMKTIPRYLPDPSWARQRSTRLNLVRTLHVWSVKISEKVVATNASTKMTSQIFKKTSTACVFHVCWLKFLLYPEKKDMSRQGWIWIPLNYSTQFVWLL